MLEQKMGVIELIVSASGAIKKKKKTRTFSKTTSPFFFESAIIGVNRVLKFGFFWEKIYQCHFSYLVDIFILDLSLQYWWLYVDMKFVSTVFCSYKMTYRSVINRKSILGIKFGPKFEYKPEFGIKNKFKYILLRHTHLLLFGELVS